MGWGCYPCPAIEEIFTYEKLYIATVYLLMLFAPSMVFVVFYTYLYDPSEYYATIFGKNGTTRYHSFLELIKMIASNATRKHH